MSDARVFGILPAKSLRYAKLRLSSHLALHARRELSIELFQIAMRAMGEVLPAGQIVVVSCDEMVLEMADQHGVSALHQSSQGLNHAVQEGQEWAIEAGAEALLIMLADLPLVTGDALWKMLAQSTGGREAILARGQRGGTHALFLRPPGWLPFTFGQGSLARYVSRVSEAGAQLVIHDSPALALDIDLPEDLKQWAMLRPDLVVTKGIDERD